MKDVRVSRCFAYK